MGVVRLPPLLRDPAAFPAAVPLGPLTDALARGVAEREHLAAKAPRAATGLS
jgi:hypothetical protein